MAYKNKNMSVIAYANGFTLWQYKTDDDIDLIDENLGYFPKTIVNLMAMGDMIFISSKGLTYIRQVVNIYNGNATIGRVN
jgi:hypothetical protein